MKKRKIIGTVLAVVCLGTAMGTTAFAADPVVTATPVSYALCEKVDCVQGVLHQHDGITYGGHHQLDGHTNHTVCQLSNCVLTDSHDHDGVSYFGHYSGDGHQHNKGNGRGQHGGGHHNGGHH